MKQFPSVFNDVIGPVMVGHSSSHTAASVRIGRVIRQLAGGRNVRSAVFTFDTEGSLATTHRSQGSDMGLVGGLLGFDTHDARLPDAIRLGREAGMDISFAVKDMGRAHPNTYYAEFVGGDGVRRTLTAVSVGGGMFSVVSFMGFDVEMDGGFFETLVLCEPSLTEGVLAAVERVTPKKRVVTVHRRQGAACVVIKTMEAVNGFVAPLGAEVFTVTPVLPVVSQIEPHVPFITAGEISAFARENGDLPLWRLAAIYESVRSGLSEGVILEKIYDIIGILRDSLNARLSEDFSDRILTNQSLLVGDGPMLGGSLDRRIIERVTRFMDIKASMLPFVAAPTAGACGCLAGTVFAVADEMGLSTEEMAKMMMCGGLVGVLIAHSATFAAEVCGCQAECGSGSGMCAAACAHVLGCGADVSMNAASMALQNIIGLACDPVANKVETPCLGKNIACAFNAVASANMAAMGFDPVIGLDETISAMYEVGLNMPASVRCTGLGGLSVTRASMELWKRFEDME